MTDKPKFTFGQTGPRDGWLKKWYDNEQAWFEKRVMAAGSPATPDDTVRASVTALKPPAGVKP